jgi:hypothetical protein
MDSFMKISKNISNEPIKKKRQALVDLENISNAASTIEHLNIKHDMSKKSRYLPVPEKKPVLSISKENLNLNPVPVCKSKSSPKSEPRSSFTFSKQLPKQEITTRYSKKSEVIKQEAIIFSPKYENIDTETDEFSCTDYASAIFDYYRQRDVKFKIGDYIERQPHITKQMRLLLVDWMVEVQQQLEFNHEILYLSVKLLDLFLNTKQIEKEKLQLLGGAAMLVACKFEERMAPPLDDFIYVSDNAYDGNDLIKMEIDILRTLQYDIGVPLSYTFMRRYAKCVKADMKFLTLARFILELSLQDYKFTGIKESLKACACLYLALKMAARYDAQNKNTGITMIITTDNLSDTEWNATLCHYTGAYLSDFIDLIPSLNDLLMQTSQSKYKTILKKYSHPVFYEVAKVPCLSTTEIESLLEKCAHDNNPSF